MINNLAYSKRAFSLIEILVVIVIVSILATIGHKAFLNYVMRSKITEAIKILDEYQSIAMSAYQSKGEIDPYYVLFGDGNETGWVSGTPGGASAEKEINLKYSSSVVASTGTSGADTYLLLGVKLEPDGKIVAGADHVYLAAIITPQGVITWKCGISTSAADTIPTEYLPNTCRETLP